MKLLQTHSPAQVYTAPSSAIRGSILYTYLYIYIIIWIDCQACSMYLKQIAIAKPSIVSKQPEDGQFGGQLELTRETRQGLFDRPRNQGIMLDEWAMNPMNQGWTLPVKASKIGGTWNTRACNVACHNPCRTEDCFASLQSHEQTGTIYLQGSS